MARSPFQFWYCPRSDACRGLEGEPPTRIMNAAWPHPKTPFEMVDRMRILFLHGWQSTPGGVKPTFLAEHGHEVLNPELPNDDFGEAVRIAQAEFDRHHPDVVVGSSRGGAVAMSINAGPRPLVLLCPAWKRWGTTTSVATPPRC